MGLSVLPIRFHSHRKNTHCRTALLLSVCLLVALTAFSATAAEPEAGTLRHGFRILASDAGAVRLAVDLQEPSWTPESVVDSEGAGKVRFDLLIPGLASAGGPGTARLPGMGSWIVVPAGTRPSLRVVSEEWNDAGGRPLAVDPLPIVIPGPGDEAGSVGEILVRPGQEIPADAPVPSSARAAFENARRNPPAAGLVLGETRWWRGRRIAPVRLNAVRLADYATAAAVLESGEWEIRFEPEKAAAKIPGAHGRRLRAEGDEHFAAGFLNPALLRSETTEAAKSFSATPAAPGQAPRKAGTLLGAEVRIPVRDTRLHRIDYASLEDMLPVGGVQEGQIRLYQRRYLRRLTDADPNGLPYLELEVPIHLEGDGGSFAAGESFVFWGLRLRDDSEFFTDLGQGLEEIPGCGDPHELSGEYNWYWLAFSEPDAGESWSRMEEITLDPAAGTPRQRYRRTDHHELQVAFRHNPPLVSSDRIYANHYKDKIGTIPLSPLWAPDPGGMEAMLQIQIAGYNAGDRDLRMDLDVAQMDSRNLEFYTLSTDRDVVRTYYVPAAEMASTSATLNVSQQSGGPMYSYLNWAELTYDALYEAEYGYLLFDTDAAPGATPIEVTGFSSSDIGLIEVTDPRQPVWVNLTASNVEADGEDWTLSIQPTVTTDERVFYAAGDWSGSGVGEWFDYHAEVVEDPTDPRDLSGADPDLVVVTHADFREALDRWVQHRIARSGGELEVHVVEAQDVYDLYTGGLADPWAIKRFTEHAITQWGSWALVLVGDANENRRTLQVQNGAMGHARDWLPTHYHIQDSGIDEPELMATDKWFVSMQYGDDASYPYDFFPGSLNTPWDMYVGRLPANSVDELNAMIDKIITVESPAAGQDWRRRGLFLADDGWSNGYGDNALLWLEHSSTEDTFESSERDSLAASWEFGSPVTLVPDTLFLDNWLSAFDHETTIDGRDVNDFRDHCEEVATPDLLAGLSRGGLLAHYQGHGNAYVLASEYWLVDRNVYNRTDVGSINNRDKPWVFFGMGCHISDWAQNTVISTTTWAESSLGEKFLTRPGAGASATIGSAGFEYIRQNRVYGEYMLRRWMLYPPGAGLNAMLPDADRSRWMIGEILWATEADLLADRGWDWGYPEMIGQYQLLGDPLMILDAGPPEVEAKVLGIPDEPLTENESHTVVALDETNLRTVEILARDEAGIDRAVVVDEATGLELPGVVVNETLPAGAVSHQEVEIELQVPLRPFRHTLAVEVYDTGAPLETDRHWTTLLDVEMDAVFVVEGDEIDPDTFEFTADQEVHLQGSVTCGAWITADMEMSLSSDNLVITNPLFEVNKSREIVIYFTAMAEDDEDIARSVDLTIDGHTTSLTIERVDPTPPTEGVANLFNFPNPMALDTEFVFETSAATAGGVLRIFSTSGLQVVTLDISQAHVGGGNRWCVPWNGLDARGDRLANGTYLYRVEMNGPSGRVASDVQRLVVMR